jgi:Family of unknown function (DUF5715)
MSFQSAQRRGHYSLAPSHPLAEQSLVIAALVALLALLTAPPPLTAQSLYGSHEAMLRQNLVAQEHDYPFLRTTQEVMQAVSGGELVAVEDTDDLQLAVDRVSFPYARTQVKSFLEQLSQAYHAACGERLVVTSLTRPLSRQPWNASPISVHPTGMAVDLRRSDRRACLQWLESTLLALEGEGMIEATREHWPPHYHVAVYPDPLLLPGPIGDPNGVVRLAALHRGIVSEPDYVSARAAGRHGRVHVVLARSARTGRLRISQSAIARRGHRGGAAGGGRIVMHRRGSRVHAVAAVSRHRVHSRSQAATTVSAR